LHWRVSACSMGFPLPNPDSGRKSGSTCPSVVRFRTTVRRRCSPPSLCVVKSIPADYLIIFYLSFKSQHIDNTVISVKTRRLASAGNHREAPRTFGCATSRRVRVMRCSPYSDADMRRIRPITTEPRSAAAAAQVKALTARITEVQIQTRQVQATVALIRALGGGWNEGGKIIACGVGWRHRR
jgi:hypothetical protein